MAKKTLAQDAKANVVGAAKTGAVEARNITGEALGAAAAAAAEVVLNRIAQALGSGSKSVSAASARSSKLKGAVEQSVAGGRRKRGAAQGAAGKGAVKKSSRPSKAAAAKSSARKTPRKNAAGKSARKSGKKSARKSAKRGSR